MLSFFKDNTILILLIAGAVVPYVLSVYEKIAEKKKTRVILVLISIGFIITLCSIIITGIQEKSLADLEQKKREMIAEINLTVSENLNVSKESLTLLEQLESEIGSKDMDEVAVELVTLDYDNLHVFEKGNLRKMPQYVSWLEQTNQNPDSTPVISLTANKGKHYFLELIIAYLLASKDNLSTILENIGDIPPEWRKFPTKDMLAEPGMLKTKVSYVLFYDEKKSNLMGFAHAGLFTKELLLYKSQGRTQEIETLFNKKGEASIAKMEQYFSSFSPNVFRSESAYEAARILIEQKLNQCIIIENDTPWFLSLAKVIKLAT